NAPRMNSDKIATTRLIQVTYPSTCVMFPASGAVLPALIGDEPPVPVRFGVPICTHIVPNDAIAFPNASITAFAMFSIASPTADSTQFPMLQPSSHNEHSAIQIHSPQPMYPAVSG